MIMFSNMEVVGFVPQFLDEDDPRPAAEQIDTAYQHGGGWQDFEGFKLTGEGDEEHTLVYPGDPPMQELSRGFLRDEKIVMFQSSWFAVIQEDGSYRVARLD